MPTVRATTALFAANSAVVAIPFPTGTLAGDLVIIFGTDVDGQYTPAGWINCGNVGGSYGSGQAAYKVVDAGDIATGSVNVAVSCCSFNGMFGAVSIIGSTQSGIREFTTTRNAPSGNRTITTSGAVQSTDLAILYGSMYGSGSASATISPGTSLSSASGVGSGSFLFSGRIASSVPVGGAQTFSFNYSNTGTMDYANVIIVQSSALSITCGNPPGGIVGSPYAHTFPTDGGTAPYTFSITSGSLPPGLTLDTAAGSVSGTPTTIGYYPFTVHVVDSLAHTANVNCSITIAVGGAWVIQEITAELIPCNPYIPGAGHFRYTARCVDAAQAGTYLGFWGALGGGGGDITGTSNVGGGNITNAPAQPSINTIEVALSGTIVGTEPEVNFIPAAGTSIAVSDDTTNKKVDVTIGSTIGGVLLEAANYSITAADYGKLISFNDASPVTATLPATPPATPWFIAIENIGAGTLTVARNGNTIDAAAADLTVNTNQGVMIFSNGSAYYTERGSGGGGTVTSLTLIEPSEFTVSGSPTTGANPTITVGKATQAAATAWMGPVSGSAAQPTFRAIQSSDLPPAASVLTLNKYVQNFSGVTSVTVNHNFGSTAVICQVYDSGGVQQLPESQTVTDANHITLTFGASFTGSAVVLGTTTRNANTVYTTSWSAQTSVTATHNLGTLQVIVQVFDGSGLKVEPESLTLTSSNVVTLTFGAAFTGSVVVMASPLAVVSISSYTTSWTSQTSVTVTHNLGTSNVAVMVTNGSGVEVEPESVTCTSANVVTLTFGGVFTGSVVVIG